MFDHKKSQNKGFDSLYKVYLYFMFSVKGWVK